MYNKEEIIKKRSINYKDLYGKRYSPSIIIRKYFWKLFTRIYSDFLSDFDFRILKWEIDGFRILVWKKNKKDEYEFYLRDNNKHCNGLFCSDYICLWIHNKPDDKDFLKFLLSFSKKWTSLKVDYFLKILASDPKIKKDYYKIFWKNERPPFSIIQDWSQDLHKMRFIVQEGILRNLDQSLEFNISKADIHHSERECLWIWPNLPFYKEFRFFNFTKEYYNHTFDKYFYLTKSEKNKYIWDKEIIDIWEFTDLNEDDIIMWKWTKKLEKSIDLIVSKIDKNNIKMLSFNCCCVPRVVWDDVYSVLHRAKEKIKVPFILEWQLERTPFEQKIVLLESYLSKIDRKDIKKKKNSISLFWYNENQNLKKLSDILKSIWIKINTIFIPTIDVKLLPLLYKSELFIFSPNKFVEEIYEYPFKAMNIDYIFPLLPYWIRNTNNWVEKICIQLWLKLKLRKEDKKLINSYQKKVEYVKKSRLRVWIVFIWKYEIDKFFNPDYMNNIDVIWFLEEMAFKIDFFVYDNFKDYLIVNNEPRYKESDWNHDLIKDTINKKVTNKNNISINYFSDEEKMYNLLWKSNIDLMYSDIYFDDRLSKLWKNQFNLSQFNLWYNWALETINKMIKLSEMKYFKMLYKYF